MRSVGLSEEGAIVMGKEVGLGLTIMSGKGDGFGVGGEIGSGVGKGVGSRVGLSVVGSF